MAGDPEQYDIVRIRELLSRAFNEEELRQLCYDHPKLQPVCTLFRTSGLAAMVDVVIQYCDRHLLFDELLEAARKKNLRGYQRFEPYFLTVGSEHDHEQSVSPKVNPNESSGAGQASMTLDAKSNAPVQTRSPISGNGRRGRWKRPWVVLAVLLPVLLLLGILYVVFRPRPGYDWESCMADGWVAQTWEDSQGIQSVSGSLQDHQRRRHQDWHE